MKKIIFIITLAIIFCFTAFTEAALVDRGGGLIYCDTLNITLLQDANYGAGSIYDNGSSTTDGRMTWDNIMAWADNLTYYDSVRDVTWDDWRLPSAYNQDGSGPESGYNVTGSEMGHLYYNEDVKHSSLINNLQLTYYWSSTEYVPPPLIPLAHGFSLSTMAHRVRPSTATHGLVGLFVMAMSALFQSPHLAYFFFPV